MGMRIRMRDMADMAHAWDMRCDKTHMTYMRDHSPPREELQAWSQISVALRAAEPFQFDAGARWVAGGVSLAGRSDRSTRRCDHQLMKTA